MGGAVEPAIRAWAAAQARTVFRGGGAAAVATAAGTRVSADPVRIDSVSPAGNWHSHDGGVSSLACTTAPSGRFLLATGGGDGGVRVWDGITGRLLQRLARHSDRVVSVAWLTTPDGELLLATAGARDGVRIWDGLVDRLLGTPLGDTSNLLRLGATGNFQSIALTATPDGRVLLATGSRDGSIRLWDGRTGAVVRTLAGHARAVTSVAWATAPDGRLLLADGSRDGTARVRDVSARGRDGRTRAVQRTFTSDQDGVSAVAWAQLPDGRLLLAVGTERGRVRVWDALADTPLPTPVVGTGTGHAGKILSLTMTVLPGGRALLAAGDEDLVFIWDALSGSRLHVGVRPSPTRALALSGLPDGRVWLIAGSEDGFTHGWWVNLAPADSAAPSREVAAPSVEVSVPPVAVSTPPAADEDDLAPVAREIDLPAWSAAPDEPATAVAWAALPDGRLLLATGGDGVVQVWDGHTGELFRGLGAAVPGYVRSVAWAVLGDGRVLLAAGGHGIASIWDGHTGEQLHSLTGHSTYVRSMAWAVPAHGPPLLALAGDEAALVWDGHTGILLHTIALDAPANSVAWAVLGDGRQLLATGQSAGRTQIWDGQTGALLRTVDDEDHPGGTTSVSWAVLSDGRLLLASGGSNGVVQIWDGHTGALLHRLTEPSGHVYSVTFAVLSGDRVLLATAGAFTERTTRIWDGLTFERLASLPGARAEDGSLAWAVPASGPVLLAATPGLSQRRTRIWAVRTGREDAAAGSGLADVAPRPVRYRQLGPLLTGLLAMGRADLWPPLGLIDDLVAVTAPGTGPPPDLNDGRLAALAEHQGIRRLRALGWPASARLAFAALLAGGITLSARYRPPADSPDAALRDALSDPLAVPGPAAPADIDLSELRAAADAVSDQLVALLTILGPEAIAADPMLPLRLAHHAARLPALSGRQVQFLSELGQLGGMAKRRSDGGLRHAPGTAGVARRGSLTQLLSTQLALPGRLLTIRYLQDQLLYRRHTARVPPNPEPVTLILDATPPTYGPAESLLRLAAHLITLILWEHGEHPVVISLAEPTVATPLTTRPQLARLWTTRTLDPPGPAISAAVETAAEAGSRLVLLAHHFAPEHRYLPGPARRLLTTHHPPEPPPPPPAHPDHYHLPADPAQGLLVETVWALLRPAGERP